MCFANCFVNSRPVCSQCCDACAGWPLSHGRRGVLTHLVAPSCSDGEPPSDAYLSLDVARAGLTLNWVGAGARLRSRLSTDTAAMLAGDLRQLSATLKHLVAVVDRSVQRVPLDRIAYPCRGCHDSECQLQQSPHRRQSLSAAAAADHPETDPQKQNAAAENDNDSGGEEIVYDDADNSIIPHIDSDPEDSTDGRRAADDDGKINFRSR